MDNAKKIKKDKYKVFSVLAGVMFLVLAAAEIVKMVADIFAPAVIAMLTGVNYVFDFSFVSILTRLGSSITPICFIVLAITAAVLLFVKKNSVAAFIPMGLITFVFFQTIFSFINSFLINLVLSMMGVGLVTIFKMVSSFVSLVCGFICAGILTALICLAAATFMKKRRFALMMILTVIILMGGLVEALAAGFVAVLMFVSLITAEYPASAMITVFYNSLISPIIYAILRLCLTIPAALSAVGLLSGNATEAALIEEAAFEELDAAMSEE